MRQVRDIIDDADLSAEQVADLALDLVDNDLLAGMETIDLSIVGELRLDSLDHIAADIDELTSGFVWSIGKGLLGDLGDMNFDAIAGKQRASGDINFINSLLQFLADNASIVSKAAYGIGSDNGISLGLVGNFLDLGDNFYKYMVIFTKYFCKVFCLHTVNLVKHSRFHKFYCLKQPYL